MKKLTFTTLTATAAALALGGATVAFADNHRAKGGDADGDGVITLEEHNSHADAMFARMDANGDGVLNAEDREQLRAEMDGKRGHQYGHRGGKRGGKRMMKLADANNDGAISRAEFDAAAKARFAKMDADKSGTITAEEREAAREAFKARRATQQ